MKSRSLLALSLILLASPLLSSHALGQQTRPTDRILDKIGKTDILYNILPLLLTKKQILELLPVLEKARDNVKKTMAKEDDVFRSIEPLADEAYKQAIEKNLLPSEESRIKLAKALAAYRIGREITANENINLVQEAFEKIANAGQRKAAANSLNVKAFVPDAKPEQMKDAEKIRLYIRYILLDGATYEMLSDMAKARKE